MGLKRIISVAATSVVMSWFAFTCVAFAQKPLIIDVLPFCARNSASLDYATDGYDLSEPVIIISSLGRKEKDKKLAAKRAEVVRNYFVNGFASGSGRTVDKVIVATSVDRAEKGRLDLYIKGELVFVFVFRRNQTFILRPSCYPD